MGQKIWYDMFLMIEYRMEQENGTEDLVWYICV